MQRSAVFLFGNFEFGTAYGVAVINREPHEPKILPPFLYFLRFHVNWLSFLVVDDPDK